MKKEKTTMEGEEDGILNNWQRFSYASGQLLDADESFLELAIDIEVQALRFST